MRGDLTTIPVQHRAHCEGVAGIMDARTTAMFIEGLRLAKADLLTDQREVIAGAAVSRTLAILEQEECGRPAPRIRLRSDR